MEPPFYTPNGAAAFLCFFPSSPRFPRLLSNSRRFGVFWSFFRAPHVLTVLYALYDLAYADPDLFLPLGEIARVAGPSPEELLSPLDLLPLSCRDTDDGNRLYRVDSSSMHLPALLYLL